MRKPPTLTRPPGSWFCTSTGVVQFARLRTTPALLRQALIGVLAAGAQPLGSTFSCRNWAMPLPSGNPSGKEEIQPAIG